MRKQVYPGNRAGFLLKNTHPRQITVILGMHAAKSEPTNLRKGTLAHFISTIGPADEAEEYQYNSSSQPQLTCLLLCGFSFYTSSEQLSYMHTCL